MNIIKRVYSIDSGFMGEFLDIRELMVNEFGPCTLEHGNQGSTNWQHLHSLYRERMGESLSAEDIIKLGWLSIIMGEGWTIVGMCDRIGYTNMNDRMHIGIENDLDAIRIKLMLP